MGRLQSKTRRQGRASRASCSTRKQDRRRWVSVASGSIAAERAEGSAGRGLTVGTLFTADLAAQPTDARASCNSQQTFVTAQRQRSIDAAVHVSRAAATSPDASVGAAVGPCQEGSSGQGFCLVSQRAHPSCGRNTAHSGCCAFNSACMLLLCFHMWCHARKCTVTKTRPQTQFFITGSSDGRGVRPTIEAAGCRGGPQWRAHHGGFCAPQRPLRLFFSRHIGSHAPPPGRENSESSYILVCTPSETRERGGYHQASHCRFYACYSYTYSPQPRDTHTYRSLKGHKVTSQYYRYPWVGVTDPTPPA